MNNNKKMKKKSGLNVLKALEKIKMDEFEAVI